jgi:hypothetical protein
MARKGRKGHKKRHEERAGPFADLIQTAFPFVPFAFFCGDRQCPPVPGCGTMFDEVHETPEEGNLK